MDPISALGLASNIVQFVQFANSLIQGTQAIYSSATGSSSSTKHLDHVFTTLSRLSKDLSAPIDQPDNTPESERCEYGPSKHTLGLQELAKTCHTYCEGLIEIVSKLKLKQGSTWRRGRSFYKAMLEAWKREDIEQLRAQIRDVEQLMVTHLCAISRYSPPSSLSNMVIQVIDTFDLVNISAILIEE